MPILTKAEMYDLVRRHGAEPGIDQAMVTGAKAESNWNTAAVGDAGHSIGLYQMHDQGLGAGMSVWERQDPDISTERMLPAYRSAFYREAANGHTDVELIVRTCLRAERPYQWEDSQSAAAQGYRRAYALSLPENTAEEIPVTDESREYVIKVSRDEILRNIDKALTYRLPKKVREALEVGAKPAAETLSRGEF